MKSSNEYLCKRSASLNFAQALEDGDHRKYDYRKNKDKPGVISYAPVMMIEDFIKDRQITEFTNIQFRRLLDKLVDRAIQKAAKKAKATGQVKPENLTDRLYVVGRICTGSNKINHPKLYFISLLEDAHELLKKKSGQ